MSALHITKENFECEVMKDGKVTNASVGFKTSRFLYFTLQKMIPAVLLGRKIGVLGNLSIAPLWNRTGNQPFIALRSASDLFLHPVLLPVP